MAQFQITKEGEKMKNYKVLWIAALVAVIVFSFAACGIIGGSFKLTSIPAGNEGKYAIVYAAKMDTSIVLVGVQSVNTAEKSVTLSRVLNGSVTVPMWKVDKDGKMTRYSGNDTLDMVVVAITNSEKMNSTDPNVILSKMAGAVPFIGSIKFTNGSASKDWKGGEGGGMFGDILKGLKF
jgi:uncharacterized lipoprotein YehR (DUF1307 family)